MSQMENSENEAELRRNEELREIQSQLESDAQHLQALYPPLNASRLDQLVDQCLTVAESSKSEAVPKPVQTNGPEKSSIEKGSAPSRRWYQVATAVCVGILLSGSLTYFLNQPGTETISKPAVANRSEPIVTSAPAVSVSRMPTELLNASPPELEAIYDEMGYVSTSIEF